MDYLKNNKWDSVYITFAEQRVHINDIDYITPNYTYTFEVIQNLIDNSNKIVIYTTCEMWNKYKGKVYPNSEPLFEYSNDYVKSKIMLRDKIYKLREDDEKWFKVKIIHPFYFNSVYRKDGFLFGKIFDSIINNKKIEIGNTNFERDMVHTKYVVKRSIESQKDEIVGSGQLFNVNKFIKDLYKEFNMDYNFYVKDNTEIKDNHSQKKYYSDQKIIYTYEMLLKDTIEDIKSKKI
jgi:nucleoside-diphosphate-sugar epimerase